MGAAASEPGPRAPGEPAPISFAQERLWFLQQLDPASAAYHLGQTFRIRGPLDAAALGRALDDVLAGQEALRTGFVADADGRARTVIAAPAPGALTFVDLGELSDEARAAALAREEDAILGPPFDLARPPLVRARLIRLGPAEHRLAICVHHLVFDGWSIAVVARELAEAYTARVDGRAPVARPRPLAYGDYAAWQRRRAAEPRWREALVWWEQRLRGLPPLELPGDRPRPAQVSGRGADRRFELSAETAERLRALARREGTTLFVVLLAAYEALLLRLSGQADFGVGVSVAGRTHHALENLAGLFVNTVVFRAELAGDPPFAEVLRRVQREAQEVLARQETPFEQVVDRAQAGRDLSRNPLFQAGLFLQNAPKADWQLGSAALEPLAAESRSAKFDLLFLLEEAPDGSLAGRIEFSTDLFAADTIDRFAGRYRVLLAAAAADPRRRLSALEYIPAAEQAEILRWRDGPVRAFGGGWIHEEPDRQPPERIALEGVEGRRLTYGQFCHEAERLARALRGWGARPEVFVGVCLERSIELVIALHAVLRAGAAYVPLDPGYPAERLAWMAEDSGAAIVVTTRALAARLPAGGARRFFIDEPWPDGPGAGPAPAAPNAAYMIYTSGSTGRPKGAVNSHEGIRNILSWVQADYPLAADDVVLLKTPFSFDVSLREFFWPLMFGARLAVAEAGAHRDPARIAALVRAHRVSVVNFVPSVFRAFLDVPAVGTGTALRRIFCTGEELTRDQVDKCRAVLGCELYNLYGPTEAAVEMTHQPCGAGSGPVPIGRPIANLEIHVLDAELRAVPMGVVGELYLGGVGLGRGYHRRPDLTAERWLPHPFKPGQRLYRTGDLGRWRADGTVEYGGRTDFQVKLRGQRIELGEIEAVLQAHPGVRAAAVVVRDAQLVAYTVAGAGPVAPDELRGWLAARLPEYMIPTGWVDLPALPLTVSGKTDRKALPAPAAAVRAHAAPRGEREEALARCWAEVLRVPAVGRGDGYFELGGDSILSIQVQARLRAAGWDFDLAELFRYPTLADLAAALRPAAARRATTEPEPFALLAPEDRAALPPGLEDAYPLTALQTAMVLHGEVHPESAAYREAFVYDVRAPWAETAFRAALAAVARRHGLLRASFALRGGAEPIQRIHADAPGPLDVSDIRLLDAAGQAAARDAWVAAELGRPVDWANPPLWRAAVQRRTDATWTFLFGVHHALVDGWSAAALLGELLGDYLERCAGRPPAPRPPPPAFARYVALERAARADETSRRFWAENLADAEVGRFPRHPKEHPSGPWSPPSPQGEGGPSSRRSPKGVGGPTSRRSPKGVGGTPVWRHWTGPDLAALQAAAARLGVSLKHLLLAAHLKVAAVYGAQSEVVVGVIANGRPEEAGAEETLGLFLNTVPVRVRIEPGPWRELVRAVFRTEEAYWPHRRFPLADMLKGRDRRPPFDTVFNFVHYHGLDAVRARADAEVLGARYFDENTFAYFAQFHQDTVQGELALELRYDPGEFTAAQAEEFADATRAAVVALAADPDARHEAAPLIPPAAREQVLRAFNAAPLPPGGPARLHDGFFASAARVPDAIALVDGDRRWTYAELAGRVGAWAAELRRGGAGPEALVGVCLERSADLVTALLAVLASGAAYVPLDPAYPAERLAFLCADARVGALVSRPELAARLPAGPWRLIDAAALAALPAGGPLPPDGALPVNLAYLIYTSGSTGRPKAAAIEHRSAGALIAWARATYRAADLAGTLFATSVCFDLSVFEVFATLAAGGRVIVAENALALNTLPARAEVTLVNTVPSAAAELVRQGGFPAGVRVVNLAGEPLSRDLADRIYSGGTVERVYDLYGPSEDTTYSTCALRAPGGPETIGRVLPGSQLYLLDAQANPVPLGVSGEIYLGGAGLARGYLARPDLTAERFVPDPFGPPGARLYRTGDLARLRPDGQVEFLGRADEQVKIRGFRIELGEIQATLDRHPAVRESAVLAPADGAGRRQVVAYVAAEATAALGEALRAWVAQRLPEPYVPARFIVLGRLPRTPNGKLDRARLPAGGPAEAAVRPDRVEPRTPAERTLAAIWAAVLRIPAVAADDSYFALGGDSILALQVSARARDAGLAVTPRLLFEHPTLAALAAAATAAEPDQHRLGTTAIAAAADGAATDGALTPIQRWFFAQDFAEPHQWNQAVLLRARVALDAAALAQAFATVGARHPALRSRFARDPRGDGPWTVRTDAGPAFAFRVESRPDAGALEAACAAEQARLDLDRGPLARAVWFAGAGRIGDADAGRLFIAIHHLAVDGVSWRILLDELGSVYAALREGREAALAPPGPGPSVWARALAARVHADGFDSERAHWAAVAASASEPLPRDLPGRDNTVASAGSVAIALEPAETETLLRRALAAHGCRIDELLLAALALALREWTGREAHRVDLEGHGRDSLDGGPDIGGSVGWFTALFPVCLDLRGAAEATRALGAVQAQLARVPRRGLGYGAGRFLADPPLWEAAPAEICFNYLGQFDGSFGLESLFAPATESTGPAASPSGHRPHLIEVNGLIAEGRLQFEWRYPTAQLARATVVRLAERHRAHVRALVAAAGTPGGGADVAELDGTDIDRAIAEIQL